MKAEFRWLDRKESQVSDMDLSTERGTWERWLRRTQEERDAARADLIASAQTAAQFQRERDELDAENQRLREQAGEMALEIMALQDERNGQAVKIERLVAAARAFKHPTLDAVPAAETGSGEE
jgi:hypothetical protein